MEDEKTKIRVITDVYRNAFDKINEQISKKVEESLIPLKHKLENEIREMFSQ